jgi:hypothetical protein
MLECLRNDAHLLSPKVLEGHVIPLLKDVVQHQEAYRTEPILRDIYHDTIQAFLTSHICQKITAEPMRPPGTNIDVRPGCGCNDCHTLDSLVAQPNTGRAKFPRKEMLRNHIASRLISGFDIDVH